MVVVSKSDYEEFRKQRVEENKKRMEQLNLNQLSQALRVSSVPKPSPSKQAKPRTPRTPRQPAELFPVRRSDRVAEKPQLNYREPRLEPLERHVRRGCYKREDLSNRIYASDEARIYAIDRAENVQLSLKSDFPNFVKPMLQSHVTGGFWLGLPNHFCKAHLPNHDEMITLVDEKGNESLTKYLVEKTGLSGGWRGFAIDHKLVDGDALVFELIAPTKFKVYIVRVNESEDGDGEEDEEETLLVKSSTKRIRTSRS